MQFGAYDYVTWAKGKSADEVYKGELDLVRKAEELGFSHYFLPEHHFLDFCLLPNQEIFMAAAAALTRKIQLVPFGFLINYRHPIRTAETVAMIDNISNGRMHLGISRGSVEWEYNQFGASWKEPERREVFQESFDVTLAALRDFPFSYHGKHFDYDKIEVLPRPLQKPYPPVWFPGTQSEVSTKWAASHGMNTAAQYVSNGTAKQIFDMFRSGWIPSSAAKEPIIALQRHIVVRETTAEAKKVAMDPLYGFWTHIFSYRHYAGLETNLEWYRASIEGAGKSSNTKPWEDYDFLDRHNIVLVGDPETVAKKIMQTIQETGINFMTGIFHFGSLSIEDAGKTMELFSKKVIPLVSGATIQGPMSSG
jgi:alkanesulfonate monooxygenase SsuD/methylene tetrahydromethanopterin reductase-like flavin-dependent oxidoreductase (luciferase family)